MRRESTAGRWLSISGRAWLALACELLAAGCFHGIREMEQVDLRSGDHLTAPAWVAGRPTSPPERTFVVSTREHLRRADSEDGIRDLFRQEIQFEIDYLWNEETDNICRPMAGLADGETLDGDDVPVLRRSSVCLRIGEPPAGCPAGSCSTFRDMADLYRATGPDRLRWYAPSGGPAVPAVGFQGMDVCWLLRLVSSLDPEGLREIPAVYRLRPDLTAAPALVCDSGWVDRWFDAADMSGDGRVTAHTTDLFDMSQDPAWWPTRFGLPEPTAYYDLDGGGTYDRGYDYLSMVAGVGAVTGFPVPPDLVRLCSPLGFGGRVSASMCSAALPGDLIDFAGANCHVTGGCDGEGNWIPDQPQEITLEDLRCQGELPAIAIGDVRPDFVYDRCRLPAVVDPDDPLEDDGFNGFNCPWQAMKVDTRGVKDFDFSRLEALGATVRNLKIHYAPDNTQPAFCREIRADTAPVVTTNRSDFDLSWVDDAGKPALKLATTLGASVYIDGDPAMQMWVTRLRADITLAPQTCDERADRTCTEWTVVPADEPLASPRFRWTETGGGVNYGCLEELTCGYTGGGACCAADREVGPFFPDWDAPSGEPAPSKELALASNNLFFRVGVDVSTEADFEYLWACDLAGVACAAAWTAVGACVVLRFFFPFLGPTCEWLAFFAGNVACQPLADCQAGERAAWAELGSQAGKIRAKFYNTVADIAYWGMDRVSSVARDDGTWGDQQIDGETQPGSDEMAAARHYLHKWFWRPVLPALEEGSAEFDEFSLPAATVHGIQFTGIEWDGTSRDRVKFSFRWDKDDDGWDDGFEDNCANLYNPDQQDWNRNGIGDVCEYDYDGDHCCISGAGVNPPPDGYYCACTAAQEAAGQCRQWYDQNVYGGSLDRDGDTIADDCDMDEDGDGIENSADNCVAVRNPLQANWDVYDGGNACDPDDDDWEDWDCPDWIECPSPEGPLPDPDLACVQGQWRTAIVWTDADRPGDLALCPPCEAGHVCVWTGWRADPRHGVFPVYECLPEATEDLPGCISPPLRGYDASGARRGSPEELCVIDIGTGEESFGGACGLYAASRIPCVADPSRPDCCVVCEEPEIYEFGPEGEEYAVINTATIGFDPIDMYGMDVAVINDMNANGFRELAVSVPYGAGSAGRMQGTVILVDGRDGGIVRESPRPGVLGTAIGRLGFRVLATYSESPNVGVSGAAAVQPPPGGGTLAGAILYDELGFDTASIAPPAGVRDPLDATATSVNIWGREMVALRWPNCNGKRDTGCIRVIDMSGGVFRDLAGRASGDGFGTVIDTDGRYGIVGVPGANSGRGEYQVFDFKTNTSWTVRNGQYSGLGRAGAIVEAADGARLVTYAERGGVPVIVEMKMRGQPVDAYPLPEDFTLVKIVSPMVENRRTTDTYALVFRDAAGDVFHVWVRAGGPAW